MSLIPPFPYFPWNGTIEVHPDGSVWRVRSRGRACDPHRIDLPDGSKGYRKVVLPEAGRWRSFGAHRIVWWWHYGEPPDQINHKNLVKDDNRVENLEVMTGAQNIQHSYDNGRTRPWSKATAYRGRARLDEQAGAMRKRRAEGALLREIAEEFGCSTSHAFRLCRGEGGSGE